MSGRHFLIYFLTGPRVWTSCILTMSVWVVLPLFLFIQELSATNNPVYMYQANFNYEIESCLHICTILITSLLLEFRKVNDILKSNPEEKKNKCEVIILPRGKISSESLKFFFFNHVVKRSWPCSRMNKDVRSLPALKMWRLVTGRCSKLVCASKLCREYIYFIIVILNKNGSHKAVSRMLWFCGFNTGIEYLISEKDELLCTYCATIFYCVVLPLFKCLKKPYFLEGVWSM